MAEMKTIFNILHVLCVSYLIYKIIPANYFIIEPFKYFLLNNLHTILQVDPLIFTYSKNVEFTRYMILFHQYYFHF